MAMAATKENLRDQIALAVTSIQWSYGIFWSLSSTQSGVLQLQWEDGYYNGDIKTRKTVQCKELDPDQMGLQRSEQLRELYASLATTGETNVQAAKRPSAALSPEDLTDTEWYYLVCMSFAFNIGQGLPGQTYRNGQPTWLCNADIVNSKVFTRSLLAKSASIQTIVCFPFLDGVIELGVTDIVSKDLSLVEYIKTNFLERNFPIFPSNFLPNSQQNTHIVKEQHFIGLEDEIPATKMRPLTDFEVINMDSPHNSSNGLYPIQIADDCFMVDEINDEEFLNSSDCLSQSFIEVENVQDDDHRCLVEPKNDDFHYKTLLSSIFKAPDQLVYRPRFGNGTVMMSSFEKWKHDGFVGGCLNTGSGLKSQKLLKKVLFQVAKMHSNKFLLEPHEENGKICRLEVEGIDVNNAVLEKRRREKINEQFSILRSLIPSKTKVDKVSVLDDTIEHLQELKKRAQELEKPRDNHKRKASDLDKTVPNNIISRVSSKEFSSSDNISVSIIQKDVVIEIKCSWRECLLFEIINAVRSIRLDSHSVQSSTSNGVLSVTIKSKLKGAKTTSAAKIRQTLERIVH